MADTSGFGHIPGMVLLNGGKLNPQKVDQTLLEMYHSKYPSHRDTFLLPVHVIFNEIDGRIEPSVLFDIGHAASNLKPWTGRGDSGETFALQGTITRAQLELISGKRGVKFIWLLNDRSRWTYHWPGIY